MTGGLATEAEKQFLIDYAEHRPLPLMARDLGISVNGVRARAQRLVGEITQNIPRHNMIERLGPEAAAAYWRIRFETLEFRFLNRSARARSAALAQHARRLNVARQVVGVV